MRPFDGNFHIPPARFRQFEDSRVEESIGRRFRGGRAFHGASGPGAFRHTVTRASGTHSPVAASCTSTLTSTGPARNGVGEVKTAIW